MHILVTGANGFIGQQLVSRILDEPSLLTKGGALKRLTLMDLNFDQAFESGCVRQIKGSFADKGLLESAVADMPVDLVFHLASLPSGATEQNHQLGYEVNVTGVVNLLEILRLQDNIPTMVFASSIAVYGKPAGAAVDEQTLPKPNLSYGAQKVVGETLIADYARRGWINACSLRLPGIVVRPPEPNGAVSIFFSDLIRSLSTGIAYVSPVSPQATSWLMSAQCCVANLLHAANLSKGDMATWTLPALHLSIGDLVAAIDQLYPENSVLELISYQPDSWVEDNFGSYPPLLCPNAEQAGFVNDGDLVDLIKNAVLP